MARSWEKDLLVVLAPKSVHAKTHREILQELRARSASVEGTSLPTGFPDLQRGILKLQIDGFAGTRRRQSPSPEELKIHAGQAPPEFFLTSRGVRERDRLFSKKK